MVLSYEVKYRNCKQPSKETELFSPQSNKEFYGLRNVISRTTWIILEERDRAPDAGSVRISAQSKPCILGKRIKWGNPNYRDPTNGSVICLTVPPSPIEQLIWSLAIIVRFKHQLNFKARTIKGRLPFVHPSELPDKDHRASNLKIPSASSSSPPSLPVFNIPSISTHGINMGRHAKSPMIPVRASVRSWSNRALERAK